MEEAGGVAFDQQGNEVLEIEVEDVHQRTPIFIGSRQEVENAVDFLK